MASDFEEVAKSLGHVSRELARRWATQRLSAVERYGRILADYGTGRVGGRDAAGAYAKLAVEEAARYPSDLIGLASDYVASFARITGLRANGDKQAPGPILDIELSGAPGEIVSRTFTLENPHDVAVKLTFCANAYLDGDRALKAAPIFNPDQITVTAQGEETVTVSTKLDKRIFKSGSSYTANVAVEGFDDMIIRVHLSVTGNG